MLGLGSNLPCCASAFQCSNPGVPPYCDNSFACCPPGDSLTPSCDPTSSEFVPNNPACGAVSGPPLGGSPTTGGGSTPSCGLDAGFLTGLEAWFEDGFSAVISNLTSIPVWTCQPMMNLGSVAAVVGGGLLVSFLMGRGSKRGR